ncbi:MAG: 3-methyl-2-oxobutanoate dehydrogenase subunit VorB [Clostridia bacterium]|nr:3-methyl-2-oxobutanoate dehydrogenase subunit VorB [Clostridia bacterium]
MEKQLLKGNEAIAEAAVRAGCRFYFGYPITPQNQIPEYMSKRMPEVDGCFLQAESEVAAINMVYGAGGSGARVMTSSSSPGISLKQEGISYIAAAEVPCVIVNMVRGGPGLGSIQPSQGDYFQSTRGGGHGDYRHIVLAPSTVQEAVDLVHLAFDLAEKYRMPAIILGDGMIGQMMEPVTLPPMQEVRTEFPDYATTGKRGKDRRIINSLYIETYQLEELINRLKSRYEVAEREEVRCEEYMTDDAEIILTAFGTVSRIAKNAVKQAREMGFKVGLLRPITLWPFPTKIMNTYANNGKVKRFIDIEMNDGQMLEDVKLAVNGACPVDFIGKLGGVIPTPNEIIDSIKEGK